jgi:hypothetical protein
MSQFVRACQGLRQVQSHICAKVEVAVGPLEILSFGIWSAARRLTISNLHLETEICDFVFAQIGWCWTVLAIFAKIHLTFYQLIICWHSTTDDREALDSGAVC